MIEPNTMADLLATTLSARKSTRLPPQELLDFAAYCASKSVMVHTVEAFEIQGEWEIPRIDLGIYGPEEGLASAPWSERIKASCDEVRHVASRALNLAKVIIFEIWLDTE
jgi:hypothetical protein